MRARPSRVEERRAPRVRKDSVILVTSFICGAGRPTSMPRILNGFSRASPVALRRVTSTKASSAASSGVNYWPGETSSARWCKITSLSCRVSRSSVICSSTKGLQEPPVRATMHWPHGASILECSYSPVYHARSKATKDNSRSCTIPQRGVSCSRM